MKTTTRRGFSAVELMMSTAVLALCLVPVLALQQGATGHLDRTRGQVLAQMRAVELLETARARGFDALVAGARPAVGAAERVTFTALSGDLGRLEAVVERRGVRVRCFRLVARRDASWRIPSFDEVRTKEVS